MGNLYVLNVIQPAGQIMLGSNGFVPFPGQCGRPDAVQTVLAAIPNRANVEAYASAFLRELPREMPSTPATIPGVFRFENRYGDVQLSLAPLQEPTTPPQLDPRVESAVAYLIRMFQRPRVVVDRFSGVETALLAPLKAKLGEGYYQATEVQRGSWIQQRVEAMKQVWGNNRLTSFVAPGHRLTDEGKRYIAEHLEEMNSVLPARDLLTCILLFPRAASDEDFQLISDQIEQRLRELGKFDLDSYPRDKLLQKIEKIRSHFLDYVYVECRDIRYVYSQGCFTTRASSVLERAAQKTKLRLSKDGRKERAESRRDRAEAGREQCKQIRNRSMKTRTSQDVYEDKVPPSYGKERLFDDPRRVTPREDREDVSSHSGSVTNAGFVTNPLRTPAGIGVQPAFPFMKNELRAQVRDVLVRNQGVLASLNAESQIIWVTQQLWTIVSEAGDTSPYYRDGQFTETLRSLILSLLKSRLQQPPR